LQNQIAEIAKSVDPEKKGVEVGTASVAMAASGMDGEDLANGLIFAINKFRHSKDSEFNIHNLSEQFTSLVSEASETVTNFKNIVKHSDFDVAFQPIVDAFTGHVHHYEALVRFHKDKHGTSPYETITFAEETGLISDFDLAMARKVIEKLATTPKESTISVAVNISGSSVGSGEYLEGLFELLKLHPWSKDRLIFEITESSRLADLSTANDFIQRLRKGGFDVCLDDFGAGAANFEYLSTLEVDVVKLDGPVVKNAQAAPKGRAFLKALISLCKELEVETIAEMIDSKEGLDFVRDCGINYVQGYLVGKPFTDMSGFLKKRDEDLFGPVT
ncbi:MAG TPA: EAL domain-containing protein, partial [Rhodospirillales bacterium]|nr:EAL domain-containing protein [Rhodospirillales bacterium]